MRTGFIAVLLICIGWAHGTAEELPLAMTNVIRTAGHSGVAVDAEGSVYVTGLGGPPLGQTTPGVAFPTLPEGSGGASFLVKFDKRGTLLYATWIPGWSVGIAPRVRFAPANITKPKEDPHEISLDAVVRDLRRVRSDQDRQHSGRDP